MPERGKDGVPLADVIDKAVFATLDALPRARRRDPDSGSVAVGRGVRSALGEAWGKKPIVHALIVVA